MILILYAKFHLVFFFINLFVIKLPLIIVHLLSDISVTYPKKTPKNLLHISVSGIHYRDFFL